MSSTSSSQPPSIGECFKHTQNALKNVQLTFSPVLNAVVRQENVLSGLQNQIDTLKQEIKRFRSQEENKKTKKDKKVKKTKKAKKAKKAKNIQETDVIDEQSGETWADVKESIRCSGIATKIRKSNKSQRSKQSDVEETSKKAEAIMLSASDESDVEPELKLSPFKQCPHCGAKIHCACRKCPHCREPALKQDKRSKADRERRERKRQKTNHDGNTVKKLKFNNTIFSA